MYIKIYNPALEGIGPLTMVSEDGQSLSQLTMNGQRYFENNQGMYAAFKEELPAFVRTVEWLDRYFAGLQPEIKELRLAPAGTEFQQIIWKLLCDIPYGKTVSYGYIAKKAAAIMGRERMSAQAVGGAVGHNPIGIIIPCHRVIGADGSLTGYGGGLDRKILLLEHEKRNCK